MKWRNAIIPWNFLKFYFEYYMIHTEIHIEVCTVSVCYVCLCTTYEYVEERAFLACRQPCIIDVYNKRRSFLKFINVIQYSIRLNILILLYK